jgi:Ca2+-binding RTX toxin-like protein
MQDNLENAVIYGSEVQFAIGNSVDNIISVIQKTGDVGVVTLFGGDGNDNLYGYYGKGVRGYASLPADMDDAKDRDADDYLVGGSGNDILDGGKGVDTMEGGLGNDTIYVDNTFDDTDSLTFDKIWEFNYEGDPAFGGQDWVISSVNIDLKDIYNANDATLGFTQLEYVANGMFIENLQGDANLLSGNWLNNSIVGGGGDNSLFGEAGSDTLIGDDGDDWLDGGAGQGLTDILNGTSAKLKGDYERDTLTGGELYVLGDADNVFYNSGNQSGDIDYAYIFDAVALGSVMLQVKGFDAPNNGYIASFNTNSFRFGATGQGANLGAGLYLYRDNPTPLTAVLGSLGAEDDLIAFLQDLNGTVTLKLV